MMRMKRIKRAMLIALCISCFYMFFGMTESMAFAMTYGDVSGDDISLSGTVTEGENIIIRNGMKMKWKFTPEKSSIYKIVEAGFDVYVFRSNDKKNMQTREVSGSHECFLEANVTYEIITAFARIIGDGEEYTLNITDASSEYSGNCVLECDNKLVADVSETKQCVYYLTVDETKRYTITLASKSSTDYSDTNSWLYIYNYDNELIEPDWDGQVPSVYTLKENTKYYMVYKSYSNSIVEFSMKKYLKPLAAHITLGKKLAKHECSIGCGENLCPYLYCEVTYEDLTTHLYTYSQLKATDADFRYTWRDVYGNILSYKIITDEYNGNELTDYCCNKGGDIGLEYSYADEWAKRDGSTVLLDVLSDICVDSIENMDVPEISPGSNTVQVHRWYKFVAPSTGDSGERGNEYAPDGLIAKPVDGALKKLGDSECLVAGKTYYLNYASAMNDTDDPFSGLTDFNFKAFKELSEGDNYISVNTGYDGDFAQKYLFTAEKAAYWLKTLDSGLNLNFMIMTTDGKVVVQNDKSGDFVRKIDVTPGCDYVLCFTTEYTSTATKVKNFYLRIMEYDGVTSIKVKKFNRPVYDLGRSALGSMNTEVRYTLVYDDGHTKDCLASDEDVAAKYITEVTKLNSDYMLVVVDNSIISGQLKVPFSDITQIETTKLGEDKLEYTFDTLGQHVIKIVAQTTGYMRFVADGIEPSAGYSYSLVKGDDLVNQGYVNDYFTIIRKGETYYLAVYSFIPKLKISISMQPNVVKEATCKESGVWLVYEYDDTKGDYVLVEDVMPVISHTTSAWTVVSKATTASAGKMVKKCTMCGDVSETATIARIASATLSATSFVYDGTAKIPTVVVKDSAGKVISASNYSVTFSNNKYIGTGTAKITFKGSKYSGTVTRSFTIKPAATKITKFENTASGVKVTWAKSSQATGYTVYRSVNGGKYAKIKTITKGATVSYVDAAAKTNGAKVAYKIVVNKLVSGKTYSSAVCTAKATYFLSPVATVLLSNSASKSIKVSYTKNAKASGYQIRYSLYSSMSGAKAVTASGYTSTSKTITGLTKGKKYYISVRSYKKVGTKVYYSSWSSAKGCLVSK